MEISRYGVELASPGFEGIRGDGFKGDAFSVPQRSTFLEPGRQVLALAHIKGTKLVAALCHSLNAHPSDTDATTD